MMLKVAFVLFVVLSDHNVQLYENGLARRPPMGWLSWSRFACETDCKKYPKTCIHERLYKETADAFVAHGFKDAGYEYVAIDDCWSELNRNSTNHRMIPHHERFPGGIKGIADHVHKLGLKFGLSSDIGTKTCAGYPGHLNEEGKSPKHFFDVDAETFAEWHVDSLKVDGCNIDPTPVMDPNYEKLSLALNKTGRPILLCCSGPFFQGRNGKMPAGKIDFTRYKQHCNGWRYMEDIWPNWFNRTAWESVVDIIDFWKQNFEVYRLYHGPGNWFDPDALIIGNNLLTKEQEKAHMAIWAMMAAPLIMSNDVRDVPELSKKILLNKHIIQVDQDPAGIPGTAVIVDDDKEAWVKQLTTDQTDSYAVVYFNRESVLATMSYQVGRFLPAKGDFTYRVYDLFDDAKYIGYIKSNEQLELNVPATEIRMLKLVQVENRSSNDL